MSAIVIRGAPEAQKLLNSLQGNELQNRVRRGTRAGAKILREETQRQAKARADIPDSFAKTATKGHRTPVGTSTGPSSPLLNIFEVGAGAHPIGGRGQRLTNVNRESGGEPLFFARGPVKHPGMAARPLIGPIFEDKQDEASDATMTVVMEGLR